MGEEGFEIVHTSRTNDEFGDVPGEGELGGGVANMPPSVPESKRSGTSNSKKKACLAAFALLAVCAVAVATAFGVTAAKRNNSSSEIAVSAANHVGGDGGDLECEDPVQPPPQDARNPRAVRIDHCYPCLQVLPPLLSTHPFRSTPKSQNTIEDGSTIEDGGIAFSNDQRGPIRRALRKGPQAVMRTSEALAVAKKKVKNASAKTTVSGVLLLFPHIES